jgi:hypothetical protein
MLHHAAPSRTMLLKGKRQAHLKGFQGFSRYNHCTHPLYTHLETWALNRELTKHLRKSLSVACTPLKERSLNGKV